jgi:hypothetical protein
MEILLKRIYHSQGVNGVISVSGQKLCESIELPWRENQAEISCIPEGRYLLRLRRSAKFAEHLEVCGVQSRRFILIHPANDALSELRGCIAPVLQTRGAGKGVFSKKAMERVLNHCKSAWRNESSVYLMIKG